MQIEMVCIPIPATVKYREMSDSASTREMITWTHQDLPVVWVNFRLAPLELDNEQVGDAGGFSRQEL